MQKESDHERRIEEEFDRHIRQELLKTSNEYRKEHGLPLLSEDEFSEPEESSQAEIENKTQ